MGMNGAKSLNRLSCAGLLVAAVSLPMAAPALAETGQVSMSTAVVDPLTVVKREDLSFGSIVPSPTAGTVTVDPSDGSRSSTGGVTLVGNTHQPALLAGRGQDTRRVNIRVSPNTVTLTGPGSPMALQDFVINTDATLTQVGNSRNYRISDPDGTFEFTVGGTLNVGASQAAGTYTGSFEVTVNYF